MFAGVHACKNSVLTDRRVTCLSEKCDWFLSHCLSVTNIRPDDFIERLLGSLEDENTQDHICNYR